MQRAARLVLADGTSFEGHAFGASGTAIGEVVFTTGMTGYQEVLTDPSYTGQIVTMAAPEIGNTGANPDDEENRGARPHVAGFVVRSESIVVSNHRATETLDRYLERHGVVALAGVDTRRLVRTIRDRGAQNGAIGEASPSELADLAKSAPSMAGLDLVTRVSPKENATFTESTPAPYRTFRPRSTGAHVVAVDFGMKRNILRTFVDLGCKVSIVPGATSANDILALAPDGVFISNGPGDPAAVTYAIAMLGDLLGKKPIFGICLGHQLLALAAGAKTYKLKFGHRGLNQPVKDLTTGRVEITSQNHGFAVDVTSLPKGVRPTHVHLNDDTSEGIAVPDAKAFSVQFHPEAAAGPHDTLHLFERFLDTIEGAPSRAAS